MEIDNIATQRVLQIIRDKQSLLKELSSSVKLQMECFQDETFDEDGFDKLRERKDEYLSKVNQLNEQFDEVYPTAEEKIKDLIQRKDSLAEELHAESQKLNQLSLSLEQEEARLKEEFQKYLGLERTKIRDKRKQIKSTSTYYKTMTKQIENMSYFYDRSN